MPQAERDQVERVVDALLAAWNAHDRAAVRALYAPNYVGRDISESAPQRGPQGIDQAMARYLDAFPNLCFTNEDVIIQGDRAAVVWQARGTHRGRLMHIPATGRAVEVLGTTLLTVQDGRITRGLYIWDLAGLLRALSLLPEL